MGDVKSWIKNLLALAVIAGVALTWIGMVRDGKANASPGSSACASLQNSVTGLLDASKVPDAYGWKDTATIRRNAQTGAHLIINNPQCFDPTLVATAQTLLGSH